MVLIVFLIMVLFMLTTAFERIIYMKINILFMIKRIIFTTINIYFHVNNSLACSYKKLKGHLSAVYLLPLIFVKSTGKTLSLSFLYLY